MAENNDIQQVSSEIISNRSIRLFSFLHEVMQLRGKPTLSVKQYEKVIWFADLPRTEGCKSIFGSPGMELAESEVWLQISKPDIQSPPAAPGQLAPWLNPAQINDYNLQLPELLDRIPNPRQTQSKKHIELKNVRPIVAPLWETYVESQWWPWARESRQKKPLLDTYSELFSIYQKQKKLGEAYEVVLGLGCLQWKTPDGKRIKRHLVTAQANLSFDAASSKITIGPAAEGANLAFEQDMLDSSERPSPEDQLKIENLLDQVDDNIANQANISHMLQEWVHSISTAGSYQDAVNIENEISYTPQVTLAPAVILRKRTDQSLLRTISEIIEELKKGESVPPGIASLVSIIDSQSPAPPAPDGDAEQQKLKEIFFPLTANEEQEEIIKQFSKRQGVIVQGPPGTGKSQTIANLICHLLATGQRVLVTSQATRALKVLQNMLPPELAALCVVVLGDDQQAMDVLEGSVKNITEKYNYWAPSQNAEDISRLRQKLQDAKSLRDKNISELVALRESQTDAHQLGFGNYAGTPKEISQQLKKEQDRFNWFEDRPELDQAPPISNDDVLEFISGLSKGDSFIPDDIDLKLLDPTVLPSLSDFIKAKEQESAANQKLQEISTLRSKGEYPDLEALTPENKQELRVKLAKILDTYELLGQYNYPWVKKAVVDVLEDRHSVWQILLTNTRKQIEYINEKIEPVSGTRVSGLNGRDLRAVKSHAFKLMAHFTNQGRVGFGPFRPKVVRGAMYIMKSVYVDGQPCDTISRLEALIEYIDIADRFETLANHWSQYMETPDKTPFTIQLAEYDNLSEPLRKVLELHGYLAEYKEFTTEFQELSDPFWLRIESLKAIKSAVIASNLEEKVKSAQSPFEELTQLLSEVTATPDIHPLMKEMLIHIKTRNHHEYDSALRALKSLWAMKTLYDTRKQISALLKTQAPKFFKAISSDPVVENWQTRINAFTDAWNWARAHAWLNSVVQPEASKKLKEDLQINRKNIRDIKTQLAAALSWRHCFERMNEEERQHLLAWAIAMRRVGKGTGKYARMHRQAARKHMNKCRSAIPAWVMPIYRVAETIGASKEAFDVVIIDEASQSGPEALFLQYLAKKIVVVGDNNQISPDFVGINRGDVEKLRQKYLIDIPHNDALGVDNSFFDQAQIRYGKPIRLREHFRCKPEIIQFSNDLCYQAEPLIPVRQSGDSPLSPAIITNHVKDGHAKEIRNGILNLQEAEAIAQQIKLCCANPQYDGKKMGVVSLQGSAQAKYIEELLIKEIGAEEIEKRNLVCGDAYAFQGDERDVMFLSIVAAPNRRIGTLSAEKDLKRFNVAFSRAKDQIWLFHTAKLEHLRKECLRYKLLSYCLAPGSPQTTPHANAVDVKKIRELAILGDRSKIVPPLPFENWFEIDVFLRIHDRGYRVIPKFEIDRFRINLIVEGNTGSLAITCEDDSWDGDDQFRKDLMRQTRLERFGWHFWQIRASDFYLDPGKTMKQLWSALDKMGISAGIFTNGKPKKSNQMQFELVNRN